MEKHIVQKKKFSEERGKTAFNSADIRIFILGLLYQCLEISV